MSIPKSLWGDDFLQIVYAFAPGRYDMVAMFQAYFDESYNANLLCVAGYMFTKYRVKKFDAGWRKLLKKYHLPYFRMSACAHGNAPFDKLSRDYRIEAETKAIELIKEYADHGVAVTINPKDFDRVVIKNNVISSPYEWCMWVCLIAVRSWVQKSNRSGGIAYFFEAGHKDQGKANALMNLIFSHSGLKSEFRYKAHGFVEKIESRPAQAADLLAWQFLTECRRLAEGKELPRQDFASLVELRHHVLFPNEQHLHKLNQTISNTVISRMPDATSSLSGR
jgi:hypothetical protein